MLGVFVQLTAIYLYIELQIHTVLCVRITILHT